MCTRGCGFFGTLLASCAKGTNQRTKHCMPDLAQSFLKYLLGMPSLIIINGRSNTKDICFHTRLHYVLQYDPGRIARFFYSLKQLSVPILSMSREYIFEFIFLDHLKIGLYIPLPFLKRCCFLVKANVALIPPN